jgi:hypothetical protein
MTLAKAKAKTNETFIVQVSFTIVTKNHKNMFKAQATGEKLLPYRCLLHFPILPLDNFGAD